MIWAIWFAPRATVIITAQTTATTVSQKVTLDPTAQTDFAANRVHAQVQQQKKQLAVDFDATGTKDVGEKASGTMQLNRTSVSSNPISVPAGTSFTSGSYTFVSTESATLNGTTIGPGGVVQDSATVRVVASGIGEDYNLSARAYQPSTGGFSAQGSNMTGGTKRQVKVVTASDIQAATAKLAEQKDDTVKKQLQSAFSQDMTVIDQSYTASQAAPASAPAVDQEATGKAKLTSEVTYSLTAIAKTDLDTYFDAGLKKQLDSKGDQRVYENGSSKVTFAQFTAAEGTSTVTITATGKIGPNIEDDTIKQQAKGKRYGEVQSQLESIQGVRDVDVKFWPFWVTAVPNDVKKVNVEFKLNES